MIRRRHLSHVILAVLKLAHSIPMVVLRKLIHAGERLQILKLDVFLKILAHLLDLSIKPIVDELHSPEPTKALLLNTTQVLDTVVAAVLADSLGELEFLDVNPD